MGPHFFGIVAQPLVLRLVVVAVVMMMAMAAAPVAAMVVLVVAEAAAATVVVVSVRWFRSPPRARRSLPAAWR